ncbi:MAG: bifunctional [glutamine synthetase] adenylyltransferase/[glutamine synthetase]-adenylyl-L-tyrosine phosphorylase, partial [Rhodospirillales bacterium]|nr:bifunctional [glutamine synthetase] adenylyltransferase/[glutamine synthetase]-adenylyl-L-tyrosine phosphorylase [Rhodospirillales bacterium]
INTHRGGKQIAVEGHNIKLGRGGIREIEFFAQTQQLIWGGRQMSLRTPSTISALYALVENGHITRNIADQLAASYEFLRQSEHRLQMINDEQTQTLPDQVKGVGNLGIFMAYKGRDDFAEDLINHLRTVEDHYAVLFEEAPALSAGGDISGNLVFTGSDSDPDTLDTISKFGFQTPETVDAAIRGWHHGRYRAMRSTRAREMLTELTPALLKALGETPDPDATFLKFDEFVAGLPAGVQLFSMLYANLQLLEMLAGIMGEAPRLAELLSRRPSLFDGVLAAEFMEPPPPLEEQVSNLNAILENAEQFEDALDFSRRWTNERKFQIGLQNMRGKLSPPKAARALSNMAEAVLTCMLPVVENEFAKNHGRIPGAEFCTIAFGKLGGHEMTPTSDLDLVFVYEAPEDAPYSDGIKPLAPTQYYARLGQRFINALTAPTGEGTLYEVDMRLRPSGNSGPIACTLETFTLYHEKNAWTWERMALTRARTVTGSSKFRTKTDTAIRELICKENDSEVLLKDVASMRVRMDAEHHTESPWSIKHLRGGLVDVEFLTQYLLLLHAHETPAINSPNTWRAVKNLQQHGYLSDAHTETLLRALDLWQALQSRLHLSISTDAPPNGTRSIPIALQERLIRLGGTHNIDEIESLIRSIAENVYTLYQEIIGEPKLDDENEKIN